MKNDVEKHEEPSAPPAVIGQALLFSPEIEKRVEAEEEARGRYTLERFRVRRPEAYAACVQLLGRGKPGAEGLRRIATLLGVHHMTVAAVRDSEPEAIDTVRSKMVGRLRTAADLLLERILENPECVPPNMLALALSQLVDKAELLDGRATTRIEHTERLEIHGDWKAWVTGNLQSEKQLDGEQVREIGSSAGETPAIGAPQLDQGPAADPAGTDAKSDASDDRHEEHSAPLTAHATTGGSDPAAAAAGPDARTTAGGGSSARGGGPIEPIGNSSQKICSNGSDEPPQP